MYCSSCGAAVPTGLSYCNRCGADLRAKEESVIKSSEASPDSLVWGLVAVTTVGLCAVVALMVIMKEVVHFNEGWIKTFSFATFASFILVDIVFVWLLLRSRRHKADDKMPPPDATLRELDAAPVRTLPEPLPSVTDQTTRNLEPVPNRESGNRRR